MPYERRSFSFVLVGSLAIVQSVLFLLFFYYGMLRDAQLIYPEPEAGVAKFIYVFSLVIGLAGLIVIPPMMSFSIWGFWGTIALSAITIGFEAWAVFMIDPTAFVGLIIPALVILLLVTKRVSFLHHIV